MADIAKIIEEVKSMSVLELSELVKAIEEEFGVSAAATAVAMAGPAAGAAEAEAEEKDSYDVVLSEVGPNKMGVIKAVKDITGLGLKESKELVDNIPRAVKEGITLSEAETIQKTLIEVGATVELK
ncbi:MAG: 50S ribosomal protein L7/L12 [Oscillospiraceae bacterium]|nr:50S ribosomal protein L7/L12 [Oscillospiraceae bacterium]